MRKPSRAASFTSDTVTSFWKSTNALPRLLATCHSGLGVASASSATAGAPRAGAANPHSAAAARPASWPSARHAPRPNEPDAAPATRMPGGSAPGTQRRERVAPLRLAVEMGGEVDGRIPTAGHGNQIAGETLGLAARIADHDAAHAMAAAHLLDRGAGEVAGLRRLRRRLRARRGALSCIDQRGHRNAGLRRDPRPCGRRRRCRRRSPRDGPV